jgi:uncharacterized protein with HEPN domain
MPRDDALLVDLARAGGLIVDLLAGYDFDSFTADVRTYWAIVAQLLIVGEAVKGLSVDFCNAHREIRWSEIARMRDKLIHHYNDIDDEELWEAASADIPELLAYVRSLLPKS